MESDNPYFPLGDARNQASDTLASLPRRRFLKGLGTVVPFALASPIRAMTWRSYRVNPGSSVALYSAADTATYRELLLNHVDRVLPAEVCMPVRKAISNAPIYSAPPADHYSVHERFRSPYVLGVSAQLARTRDGLCYRLEKFVYVDDVWPARDYKDLNMLEMFTFIWLDETKQSTGMLSPCNERMQHSSADLDHLYGVAGGYGYSRKDIQPLYCRPVRTHRNKSTLAHAVEVNGERDNTGRPKRALLLSPDLI